MQTASAQAMQTHMPGPAMSMPMSIAQEGWPAFAKISKKNRTGRRAA
jgi:hypothetical protein